MDHFGDIVVMFLRGLEPYDEVSQGGLDKFKPTISLSHRLCRSILEDRLTGNGPKIGSGILGDDIASQHCAFTVRGVTCRSQILWHSAVTSLLAITQAASCAEGPKPSIYVF
jgi:hypothetical protein